MAKRRRTSSDMFFAEVRHFEEIFRQGQPPSGQSPQSQGAAGQNAQDAEQLMQVQKQIITATWNLLRQGVPTEHSQAFAEDMRVIIDAQGTAITMLKELADRINDEPV